MIDDIATVIAFLLGGAVLFWGFASLGLASMGGPSAGLHETAPPAAPGDEEQDTGPSEEDIARKKARNRAVYQLLNYGLSLAALAALVALLIGAAVA